MDTQVNDNLFTVTVFNKTFFDIEILTESRFVPHNGEAKITLPKQFNQLSEGYPITYHVKLTDEVTKKIKGGNVIIKPDQQSVAIADSLFSYNESYFTLTNTTDRVIKLRRTNSSVHRNTIGSDDRIELTQGTTNVYLVDAVSSSVETEQGALFKVPLDNTVPSFLYSFTFDGSAVTLTDARPLHRIGEASWVKTLTEATYLPYLLSSNAGNISLLAPTKNGAAFYSFTSSGEEVSPAAQSTDAPAIITAVMRMENGSLLVTGYNTDSRDLDTPLVQKQNEGGVIQWRLPPSEKYPYANILAAAAMTTDKNVWLAAGQQDTAYIRQIRDEGATVTSSWELGGGTLDPKCGAVSFVLYDTQKDLWRITGVLAEPLSGSYIIEVDSSGTVLKTDASFKNFLFYKILGDVSGAYYLAGEELKENDASYAVVIKYDASGKEIWRERNQPQAHSYYQDAVLDEENGQIVLAGTLNAKTGSGEGGTPFIQALRIDSGAKIWRREIKEDEFKGTALVSGMSKAPDYGFVLALCGISGDSPAKPFIIARVNERGLLIK
jgi:hypothetical protein